MDTSGTCGEWNVVLHIFCCGCDVQSNFWSLRKTWKTFTWNLPGFLSRKKDFWVVHPKRLDRKLGHDIFGHLTNNVASIVQGLRLLCLASEKFHVYPATQVHPIPKTMFSWIHMRFEIRKKNLSAKFSVKSCIIPLCWVTFCIHSEIIPAGHFSRKCAKSINQSIKLSPLGWLLDGR